MRHHLYLSKQRGYLLIVAVLLIMVLGFLAVAISYMLVGSANATVNFENAESALGIAEAGLEESLRQVLTPIISGSNPRIACASITGNSNLTSKSFSNGIFTATTVSGYPLAVNTTLSSAVTATSTTIPVSSTTGFAPAGRIMIDGEIINYGGISGNTFIGIQRGANENDNTPHVSGTPVAQLQCDIDVKAGIPNLSAPIAQREIQEMIQLQEGWAVGTITSTDFVLTHWNQPTETKWTSASFSNASATTLNDISMLSNVDGWAVGNAVSSKLPFLHWNGSAWSLTTLTATCSTQNLLGVSVVYHDEAWAVGATCGSGNNTSYTVAKWNGTSWSLLTPTSSIPIPANSVNNQTLNAVSVLDTNQNGSGDFGFAVGNNGVILKYNGSSWAAITSHTTNNLLDVSVISTNEAWAVGANGTILHYANGAWSVYTSPTTTTLNAMTMLDYSLSGYAETGWAVGNSGVAITYNRSTGNWTSKNTGSTSNLLGVDMFFTTPGIDVWAVGAAGLIMHYDGTSWYSITSNVSTQLNDISLVKPQQYPYAYKEIFP